jgi:hypothetical protein
MQMDQSESSVLTDDAEPPQSAQLTTEIVSAYVSHNSVVPFELAKLINTVASQLAKTGTNAEPPAEEKAQPAVSVRRSIQPDHLVRLRPAAEDAQTPAGRPTRSGAYSYRQHLAAQAELSDGRTDLCPAAA